MQRRTGRGWAELVVLVSVILLLGVAAWASNRPTPSAPATTAPAADAETDVADRATMIANDLIASLPPSPYPVPTVVLPPQPGPSVYNPRPEDPWGGSVCPRYPLKSDIKYWTEAADIIALGTVVEVAPPRWTTPDGARPTNPHTDDETIYRPVVIDVEEYLKGEQPTQRLDVFWQGGKIGQDNLDMCGDIHYAFTQGEHAVVFLAALNKWHEGYDDVLTWNVVQHYGLENDRVKQWESDPADNPSLEELRGMINAAQQP